MVDALAGWVWGDHGFLNNLGAVDIAGSGPVSHIPKFSHKIVCTDYFNSYCFQLQLHQWQKKQYQHIKTPSITVKVHLIGKFGLCPSFDEVIYITKDRSVCDHLQKTINRCNFLRRWFISLCVSNDVRPTAGSIC